MCHSLFWVFDYLLVLICFLVLAFEMACIVTHRKLFPAIQVFAVLCAVCCLCLYNRLRLNFPLYQIFPSRWLQSCLGVCLVPPRLGLPSPAPPHICQREGRFHLLSTQSRFCQLMYVRAYYQEYIEKSLEGGGKVESGRVPWRHLLTSIPLWGCVLGLSMFVCLSVFFSVYASLCVCLLL